MKILALTGGIASGKSTVAKMFSDLGAVVIFADPIAHEVYRPGTAVFRALVRRYGKSILNAQGRIDRKKLAAVLFQSKKEKGWLEGKIHPEVRRIVERRIQKARKRNPPLILVEAALHVETGYGRSFEGLIVVASDPAQQMQRLVAREALTLAEGRRRLKNQASPRRRLRHADWVIDNSGTLSRTRSQVRKLFKKLMTVKPPAPRREPSR